MPDASAKMFWQQIGAEVGTTPNVAITPEESSADSRKFTMWAYGLIVLAFVANPVAQSFGIGSTFRSGEHMVYILTTLAIGMGIAALVTRGRSDRAKAIGRLVIAVMLCISVGGQLARAVNEKQTLRRFMSDISAIKQGYDAKMLDTVARIEALKLGEYMTPSGLANPGTVASSKEVVKRYRTLQTELRTTAIDYMAESTRFVQALPAEAMWEEARSGFAATKKSTLKRFEELGEAQGAHADALDAVLAWATKYASQIEVQDERFVLGSPEAQSELVRVAGQLEAAEKAVDEVAAKIQAAEEEAGQKREELERLLK